MPTIKNVTDQGVHVQPVAHTPLTEVLTVQPGESVVVSDAVLEYLSTRALGWYEVVA